MIIEYIVPYKELILLILSTLAAVGLVSLFTAMFTDNGWLAFIGGVLMFVPFFSLFLIVALLRLIEEWAKVVIAIAGA